MIDVTLVVFTSQHFPFCGLVHNYLVVLISPTIVTHTQLGDFILFITQMTLSNHKQEEVLEYSILAWSLSHTVVCTCLDTVQYIRFIHIITLLQSFSSTMT